MEPTLAILTLSFPFVKIPVDYRYQDLSTSAAGGETPLAVKTWITTGQKSSRVHISQPVQNITDKSTSQNALSVATVLRVKGGGAVILALLGFMAAVRQKKRGSFAVRRKACCVRKPEDSEGAIVVSAGCCDTNRVMKTTMHKHPRCFL
jgi:hypothetical protein